MGLVYMRHIRSTEAPILPSSMNKWICLLCCLNVFQNNDGFQHISCSTSLQQSLSIFLPRFLRATTPNISYTSSSHTTLWLKGGLQRIEKCHPVLHHSISDWNSGAFFIPSHFPDSGFLFPKFGTATLAAYHCTAACFFMALGITIHVLRWHFRGSLRFFVKNCHKELVFSIKLGC